MIHAVSGLTASQLGALAALETRTVTSDGGRLKLEWETLRSRRKDQTRDFLCWSADGSQLLGFAGIYAFGQSTPEIATVVDPEHRRQGIGTGLLTAALAECRAAGHSRVLLVAPRNGAGGTEFALRHGARLEHAEHAMLLRGDPTTAAARPDIDVRVAVCADVPRIRGLLEQGFGFALPDDGGPMETEHKCQLVAEQDGTVVSCLHTSIVDGRGGVYGFVVAADRRGQGIGRDVLRRACANLRERGATEIGLEVATDNDNALGLYESLGFERVITEDYYELSV